MDRQMSAPAGTGRYASRQNQPPPSTVGKIGRYVCQEQLLNLKLTFIVTNRSFPLFSVLHKLRCALVRLFVSRLTKLDFNIHNKCLKTLKLHQ